MHYKTKQKRMQLINCLIKTAINWKNGKVVIEGKILKHSEYEKYYLDAIFALEVHRKNYPELLDIERA